MVCMSQTQSILRQPAGRPVGGQFASHQRDDDAIHLGIGFTDALTPVSAMQSRALVESALMHIDAAEDERTYAANATDEAIAGGAYNAYGEVVAYLISNHDRETDYIAAGEQLLDERREGTLIELDNGTNWPGAWTALQRQLAVDYFRSRADEAWERAQTPGVRPDVEAHYSSQFEVFSEMSLDLSNPHQIADAA